MILNDSTHMLQIVFHKSKVKWNKKQWKYVESSSNPADDGSRGMTTNQLLKSPRWVTGPDFLWQSEDEWLQPMSIAGILFENPEVHQSCFFVSVNETWCFADATQVFSNWQHARSAVTVCLNYREKLLKKVKSDLTTSELDNKSCERQQIRTVEHLGRYHTRQISKSTNLFKWHILKQM